MRVTGTEAKRLVLEENAQLVDVRSPMEFSMGHPTAATNIPVDELPTRLSELSKERPVVLYCRSGMRSGAAASFLSARDFVVHDMGTVDAWPV